jgi:hypothetical protein
MKSSLSILVILVVGVVLHTFLPWYSIALAGIAGALLVPQGSAAKAFAWGALAGAVLWGAYAGYLNMQNGGVMAGRLGEMLGGLPGNRMIYLSTVLGGVYCGLGAVVGHFARGLVRA